MRKNILNKTDCCQHRTSSRPS